MNGLFDITDALLTLRPGAEWTSNGTGYDGITWYSTDSTIPTKEEIETELVRLRAQWEADEYKRNRASEYPPLEDLADAIYWQSKGNSEPMANYVAACEAVKDRYPKDG